METYPVYLDDTVIGTATVKREGMYNVLKCSISRRGDTLPQIVLRSENACFDCGSCMPDRDGAVLTKRLRVRDWDFAVGKVTAHYGDVSDSAEVKEGQPFLRLQDLPRAYYRADRGTVEFRAAPKGPNQLDNDPNP